MKQGGARAFGVCCLAAAVLGGCENKTTARRTVTLHPAGGMAAVAEGGERYMQQVYEAIDWHAVFAAAAKDPDLAASGWEAGSAEEAAEALAGQVQVQRTPHSSFIEITATGRDLPQAEAAAKAVADAFDRLYAKGIRPPGG